MIFGKLITNTREKDAKTQEIVELEKQYGITSKKLRELEQAEVAHNERARIIHNKKIAALRVQYDALKQKKDIAIKDKKLLDRLMCIDDWQVRDNFKELAKEANIDGMQMISVVYNELPTILLSLVNGLNAVQSNFNTLVDTVTSNFNTLLFSRTDNVNVDNDNPNIVTYHSPRNTI